MYKYRKRSKTILGGVEKVEGEPIEHKIERIVDNNEPIKDGAPEIFTERKDGVVSAYNIRTDRWEIATDGMSLVERSITAKRDNKGKKPETEESKKEAKVVDIKDGVPESIKGTGTDTSK
tara:strand:+ start:3267 stop:3626 length:360 start_codon:yes stop_codon:yes gene_type:complete